jgi:arylsulfatase A-like enzyme
MLEDYNLIVLCAEAFFPGAIHEEVTPTLYKLANSGFVFQNYYTTFPNNTTDGEYTLCMGLYPDMSRGKTMASFYASRESYLPYCLGNIFSQQKGVSGYGYHNYLGSYYGRDESHTNMGYEMKFADAGMEFTTDWPSSDLEMMMQSVDDYIDSGEQFHAYYMTFSGHLSYDRDTNPMAHRNWEAVKHLPYSNEAKAYISCNIELDKALAYLMQRLEEAGIADKTAIVLTADHHPYGLTDSQCGELRGENIIKLNKFKSSLIFWVGGLEKPVIVDEYCCTVDVLPTILNLWGFEFDSRMLAGTDVFSDGIHVAVLKDKTFFTDKVWVETEYGIIKYLVDPEELPEGYIENMMQLIETKFSLSSDILNSAYYNFVFEKGEVAVNRHSWE